MADTVSHGGASLVGKFVRLSGLGWDGSILPPQNTVHRITRDDMEGAVGFTWEGRVVWAWLVSPTSGWGGTILTPAEAMLEELVEALPSLGHRTFTIDEVVRDDSGRIVTLYGTEERWNYVAGSLPDTGWWERTGQSPLILGEV